MIHNQLDVQGMKTFSVGDEVLVPHQWPLERSAANGRSNGKPLTLVIPMLEMLFLLRDPEKGESLSFGVLYNSVLSNRLGNEAEMYCGRLE